MTRTPKREPLVRYISPYGSPAWMPRAQAERYLDEDDRRWVRDQRLGLVDASMRRVGAPRIEAGPK